VPPLLTSRGATGPGTLVELGGKRDQALNQRPDFRDDRLEACHFGALGVGDRFLLPSRELLGVKGEKLDGVLRFLKREFDDGRGKRGRRIGEEFLDPADVGLQDGLCTVEESADLRQRRDGLEGWGGHRCLAGDAGLKASNVGSQASWSVCTVARFRELRMLPCG
jgi:hypothetical protein